MSAPSGINDWKRGTPPKKRAQLTNKSSSHVHDVSTESQLRVFRTYTIRSFCGILERLELLLSFHFPFIIIYYCFIFTAVFIRILTEVGEETETSLYFSQNQCQQKHSQ